LLQLAVAELFDAMRVTEQQIIIVDMIEIGSCHKDAKKALYKRNVGLD